MESMFLWIVLFSGAAVLLLSLFLISSERELKKKRGEIEDLVTRLEGAPTASANPTGNGPEVTGLRTKIQELQKDRAALQDDLDTAHRAIEELRSGQPGMTSGATLAEVERLRNANTQLDAQIIELRDKLEANEAKLQNTGTTEQAVNERQTQLENSLIEFKRQLERSQAKVRELENAPAPVADVSVLEASHREEAQKLHARIGELEHNLAASADLARQIESLRHRIGESEKIEQELRDSLRWREEEIPLWQERIAASEEIKKRLVALQPVYDQLVAKQSSLIEHQRAYHGDLKSFAEFLSASHDGTIAPPTYFDPQAEEESTPAAPSMHMAMAGHGKATPNATASLDAGPVNGAVETAAKAKRGFGVFHAIIALIVCGVVAALFWSQSAQEPVTYAAKPVPLAGPEKTTATRLITQQPAVAAEEVAPATLDRKRAETVVAQTVKPAKAQPAAAVAGTYEVTRGTRVFAAPTEFAQQVGEIEPGLKVNVVNARDGWLEIHSKHGRPPGYIRSDAVARVGG